MFGQNDKPLYIQGPSDSPARVARILRALEARCGEGGYHYIVAGDHFESCDGEEQNGDSAVIDPVRRKGLERMAAGLASQPGMEVRINPPGHGKISAMIWQVAEPLLESVTDYESKDMILKLTTMAWNFTLLDPVEQEEALAEVADLFRCPEGVIDMFYYLADRKALLFPEEESVICKVETGPALYSDIALRVRG